MTLPIQLVEIFEAKTTLLKAFTVMTDVLLLAAVQASLITTAL